MTSVVLGPHDDGAVPCHLTGRHGAVKSLSPSLSMPSYQHAGCFVKLSLLNTYQPFITQAPPQTTLPNTTSTSGSALNGQTHGSVAFHDCSQAWCKSAQNQAQTRTVITLDPYPCILTTLYCQAASCPESSPQRQRTNAPILPSIKP